MKDKHFVVQHPSQLNALSIWPLARKPGIGRIVLGPELRHSEKENWEKLLNQDYYACGCDTGAKALVAGLLGCLTIAAYAYLVGRMSMGTALLISLGGPVLFAGLGKLYGLAKASEGLRRQFARFSPTGR